MLFIRPRKLTSQEGSVIKRTTVSLLLSISFLSGQSIVQVKLKNGTTVDGEFIGTYMEHVHLLTGENIDYFKCDDIQSVTKLGYINPFKYDCSKNTVSSDILFPPQLNPMTGQWETIIPDVFNPKKRKVLAKEEEKLVIQKKPASKNKKQKEEETLTKNNEWETLAISKEQLDKTKNTFREIINPKIKSTISGAFYEDAKEEPKKKNIKEKLIPYYYEDGAVSFSEDKIRRFIKKEVRKELRRALPYEIKKHKEERQNKLFQNILLGCGAWFLFMIMLS